MEFLGGLVLSIVAMVLLALVGLTTVFALGFMTVLGLLTEMSFKRLFFVSFAMALAAPVLLGLATFAAIADGSLERDLRRDLGQVIDLPPEAGGNWREAIPKLRDLRDDIENGELTDQEIEQRIEDLFDGSEGTTIDLDNAQPDDAGQEATVNVDGVELIQDGDTLQIQID